MTLLVISPDYASHVLPMLSVARDVRVGDERVVVATGPATDHLVTSAGFERVDLRLGRGSNPGVIRAEEQPAGEDDHLRAFFAATRRGMVATLRYQADARRQDLLWEPVAAARRVLDLVARVDPDLVLVDHLAFGATLALQAARIPYTDVVLGHPSALPVGDEVYGELGDHPPAMRTDADEVAALRARCVDVRDAFTDDWNRASTVIDADATPVDDAFAVHGDLVAFHYHERLHDPARTGSLPRHVFLGPRPRSETLPEELVARLGPAEARPLIHVSFGSFLSERADVLAVVAAALASIDVRVSMAIGSTDRNVFGPLPDDWVVAASLPQVALLAHASVAVTHGGNNSVMEALAAGVPMIVLPFSTDQFAGAAAVERAGVGVALDPNSVTPNELADALAQVLRGSAPGVVRMFATDRPTVDPLADPAAPLPSRHRSGSARRA